MAKKSQKTEAEEELAALAEAGLLDDPEDEPEEPEAKKAEAAQKSKKPAPDGLSPADLAVAWNTTGAVVRRALRKVAEDHLSRERWTLQVADGAHRQGRLRPTSEGRRPAEGQGQEGEEVQEELIASPLPRQRSG